MKKIVIIGAGPAGLTAGCEILRRSDQYQVTVLEESSEIGGISRTVCHNGNRMDIGGHRFFTKDQRVLEWWLKIMPLEGREVPASAERVMLKRKRLSRIYYKKKFFDYPVKLNVNTIANMGPGTTISAGFSYLKSLLCRLPEDSLENFYINRFGRKLYSMFFEDYTTKVWGRHPSEISADWGAQRVKGLSIFGILKDICSKALPGRERRKVETSLIEEFMYPKLGPGQLWEAAAAEFEALGGELRKNCRASAFTCTGDHIDGVICESGSRTETVLCDYLFSSMPLKDLVKGLPDVPEDISRIAGGLPYRDFVTVGLLVRRGENEISSVPDCWIYVQDPGVRMGRIQIFNNWSPYLNTDPENTVWVGLEYFCDEGDADWTMGEEEWKARAAKELMKIGMIGSEKEILDFCCVKVKKAYPAYFDTYQDMDRLVRYLDGFGNLFCIGRNGQHRYNNMDHSMATAFEAVDNLLTHKETKENIWKVNTEKEYHEEKGSRSCAS